MIDYAEVAADALAAIQDVGASTTLYRKGLPGGTSHDPLFPPDTPFTINYVDISSSSSDLSAQVKNKGGRNFGDLVEVIAHTILVAVYPGGPPKKDDMVDLGGVRFRVASVTTTAPAGIDVLYELGLVA